MNVGQIAWNRAIPPSLHCAYELCSYEDFVIVINKINILFYFILCFKLFLFQPKCLGRFLGTINRDPGVSKSKWLHVDIFKSSLLI